MSPDPWRPRPRALEDVMREDGPSACIGCPLVNGCDLACLIHDGITVGLAGVA